MGNTRGSGTGQDKASLLYRENGQVIWVTPGAVEQASTPVYRERTDYMGNTRGSGTGRDKAALLYTENGQIIWVTPGAVELARTRHHSCIERMDRLYG